MGQQPTTFQKICMETLMIGPIPQHVAIVPDGHRRYARDANITFKEVYEMGCFKLTEACSFSFLMGVKHVTIYLFSMHNLKRTNKDIDDVCDATANECEHLLNNVSLLLKSGIRVRFFGNFDTMPRKLQKFSSLLNLATEECNSSYANVMFGYTTCHEISQSIGLCVNAVQDKKILLEDIDQHLIEQCFYLHDTLPIELVIRTSGVRRLSDFLIWQIGYAHIESVEVQWPEFTIWHFFQLVFKFQRQFNKSSKKYPTRKELPQRVEDFLKIERKIRQSCIQQFEKLL